MLPHAAAAQCLGDQGALMRVSTIEWRWKGRTFNFPQFFKAQGHGRSYVQVYMSVCIEHICCRYFFIDYKCFQEHYVYTTKKSSGVAMASRNRRQKQVRNKHVGMIVKRMFRRLNTEGHLKRIQTTNTLLPLGSLRRASVRAIFAGWITKLVGAGRVITKKLASQVVQSLRAKMELGDSENFYEEALRMHGLLKGARKRQLQCKAMSSVDQAETQLMYQD